MDDDNRDKESYLYLGDVWSLGLVSLLLTNEGKDAQIQNNPKVPIQYPVHA